MIELTDEQKNAVAKAQSTFTDLKDNSDPLSDKHLALLFGEARSMNGWQDKEVSNDMVKSIYELTKMGPTSTNCCPARFKFIKSDDQKQLLKEALLPNNVDKVMSAPVIAIIGYDLDFSDNMSKLFPIGLIDEINKDLKFEDSLHHDLRRLTFRYIIPHALGKKSPSTIDVKEQFEGTIQGKADENKSKEILFWKSHYQNGITDDEIIESANKFKNIYEDFDNTLINQKYLKGDKFTVVDLAWYVSTKRLAMAGIPIQKYKNVQKWFSNLDNDENFKKEIKIDIPIKIIAVAIKIINKIKRTYVTDLVKF